MNSRIVRAQEPSSGMRFLVLTALAVTSSVLASCAGTTEPTTLVRIVPASETVAMQQAPYGRELKLDLTLTNTSSKPIYYDRCAVTLQRRVDGVSALAGDKTASADGVWFTVWTPICPAIAYDPPPTLQPGESVTIPFSAVAGVNMQPFDGTPGLYRVRFFLATPFFRSTRMLSPDESSSAAFTLVAN